MPQTRLVIGLSIGSGCEAVEAAAVRIDGFGLGALPRPAATIRVHLPASIRDAGRELVRRPGPVPTGFAKEIGSALVGAARRVSPDLRLAMAAGLLTRLPESDPAASTDWLAEQTGLTVVSDFAGRDLAAGGAGHLLTPAADFLLHRHPAEERLLIHLGSLATAVLLPASDRITDVAGFECGPGTRLLDDLALLGTRGRESYDPNGTLAVQGRCADDLLEHWLTEQTPRRRPQHPASRTMFTSSFLTATFESARTTGRTLNDLLCTATHFIARTIGLACSRWLPAPTTRRRVLLSGGGTRNGFLAKLVAEQFDGEPVERLESPRNATAAAVLAALTLDGVAANLPLITGATGGRLIGRLTPGDTRNWANCTAWMTSRLYDYPAVGRVA